ncbi:EutP/PduV family microcompartment system protein [Fusobacterium sp. SYSU M8A802]
MKIMLVGKTGSGKTTLIQRLKGSEVKYSKTQMISYDDRYIDTPGEYLENKMMLRNLLVSSMDVEKVIFVQSSEDTQTMFPPNISNMFMGKKIIGVITKIDKGQNIKMCEEWLKIAGATQIFHIGFNDENELNRLKAELDK